MSPNWQESYENQLTATMKGAEIHPTMTTNKDNDDKKQAFTTAQSMIPALTSTQIDVVAGWADEICMEWDGLYDGSDEKWLRQFLSEQNDLGPLALSLKEKFLDQFEEEWIHCAKPPHTDTLIGLLHDYIKAQPLEKALINFVFRRLTNLTVPMLVSGAKKRVEST